MWSRSGREIEIDRDGYVENAEGMFFVEIHHLTSDQFSKIHRLMDEMRSESRLKWKEYQKAAKHIDEPMVKNDNCIDFIGDIVRDH